MSTIDVANPPIATVQGAHPIGWLRSKPFDLTFIVGVAILALAVGLTVQARPELFAVILFLDIWLLGYNHVISTFTRLTFDTQSFKENKFLVLGLPWIILAGTLVIGYFVGIWALATTYLYWQWFHYTRQSYGIVRIFARKAGNAVPLGTWETSAIVYLLPLCGILYRSYQLSFVYEEKRFLGAAVISLPVPLWMVYMVGVAAAAPILWWLGKQLKAWRAGRLCVPLTLYVLSHIAIFSVGYLIIPNINHGWLVLNVWHNAQYILIVWMFNNNRFKRGVDSGHWFLSTLSQTRNALSYFLLCFVLSTVVYGSIAFLIAPEFGSAYATIPLATMIIYQTINFHHYVVDGLIWKMRRKKLQQTLGING